MKKLLNYIEQWTLGSIIDYIKKQFGEAKVLAEQPSFGSWAKYILAIIKDLITLVAEIKNYGNAPVPPTKAGGKSTLRTKVVTALKNKPI